jgi:hypothetical protein
MPVVPVSLSPGLRILARTLVARRDNLLGTKACSARAGSNNAVPETI